MIKKITLALIFLCASDNSFAMAPFSGCIPRTKSDCIDCCGLYCGCRLPESEDEEMCLFFRSAVVAGPSIAFIVTSLPLLAQHLGLQALLISTLSSGTVGCLGSTLCFSKAAYSCSCMDETKKAETIQRQQENRAERYNKNEQKRALLEKKRPNIDAPKVATMISPTDTRKFTTPFSAANPINNNQL